MIDFYTAATPNGRKVAIFLEEAGLPYRVHRVDIGKGEQFEPDFLKISPNNKIPAIVDRGGDDAPVPVFESGAILHYLAERSGRFMPANARGRAEVLQWLMFQMAGVGPMLGQSWWFKNSAPQKIPLAIERYENESKRLFGVMDRRLAEAEYLAGDYSIADMAVYPWVSGDWHGMPWADYPHLRRWHDGLAARPAVQRGMQIPN